MISREHKPQRGISFSQTNVDNELVQDAHRAFLELLHTDSSIQNYKTISFRLLDLEKGQHVLDVGCGTGDDCLVLSRLVGDDGLVVGVDNSQRLIDVANQKLIKLGPIHFEKGDARLLPYPAEYFDRVRIDRTLQHIDNPDQVVGQAAKVLKQNGILVISEPDWGTLIADSSRPHMTQIIFDYCRDRTIRNGRIGRQLNGLFALSGLKDREIVQSSLQYTNFETANEVLRLEGMALDCVEAGILDKSDIDEWLSQLQQNDKDGRFFASLTVFIARGKKN